MKTILLGVYRLTAACIFAIGSVWLTINGWGWGVIVVICLGAITMNGND